MKVAIMQPYFFPYLGYFQLAATVDCLVLYDDAQYTKKGWINRNRILVDGREKTITVPIEKGSDFLHIHQRRIAESYDPKSLRRQVEAGYRRAENWTKLDNWFYSTIRNSNRNLFEFLFASLASTFDILGLNVRTLRSSETGSSLDLRGENRVIDICEKLGASMYINPIGGLDLYRHSNFAAKGIQLKFLKSRLPPYSQFGESFVPALSIIDLIAHLHPDVLGRMIHEAFDVMDGEAE